MKFTLSWLKDHLDTDASLQEITDKLTALGLELEGVEVEGEEPAEGEEGTPATDAGEDGAEESKG